jgi:hypothetical protein
MSVFCFIALDSGNSYATQQSKGYPFQSDNGNQKVNNNTNYPLKSSIVNTSNTREKHNYIMDDEIVLNPKMLHKKFVNSEFEKLLNSEETWSSISEFTQQDSKNIFSILDKNAIKFAENSKQQHAKTSRQRQQIDMQNDKVIEQGRYNQMMNEDRTSTSQSFWAGICNCNSNVKSNQLIENLNSTQHSQNANMSLNFQKQNIAFQKEQKKQEEKQLLYAAEQKQQNDMRQSILFQQQIDEIKTRRDNAPANKFIFNQEVIDNQGRCTSRQLAQRADQAEPQYEQNYNIKTLTTIRPNNLPTLIHHKSFIETNKNVQMSNIGAIQIARAQNTQINKQVKQSGIIHGSVMQMHSQNHNTNLESVDGPWANFFDINRTRNIPGVNYEVDNRLLRSETHANLNSVPKNINTEENQNNYNLSISHNHISQPRKTQIQNSRQSDIQNTKNAQQNSNHSLNAREMHNNVYSNGNNNMNDNLNDRNKSYQNQNNNNEMTHSIDQRLHTEPVDQIEFYTQNPKNMQKHRMISNSYQRLTPSFYRSHKNKKTDLFLPNANHQSMLHQHDNQIDTEIYNGYQSINNANKSSEQQQQAMNYENNIHDFNHEHHNNQDIKQKYLFNDKTQIKSQKKMIFENIPSYTEENTAHRLDIGTDYESSDNGQCNDTNMLISSMKGKYQNINNIYRNYSEHNKANSNISSKSQKR